MATSWVRLSARMRISWARPGLVRESMASMICESLRDSGPYRATFSAAETGLKLVFWKAFVSKREGEEVMAFLRAHRRGAQKRRGSPLPRPEPGTNRKPGRERARAPWRGMRTSGCARDGIGQGCLDPRSGERRGGQEG